MGDVKVSLCQSLAVCNKKSKVFYNSWGGLGAVEILADIFQCNVHYRSFQFQRHALQLCYHQCFMILLLRLFFKDSLQSKRWF